MKFELQIMDEYVGETLGELADEVLPPYEGDAENDPAWIALQKELATTVGKWENDDGGFTLVFDSETGDASLKRPD